MRLSGSTKAPSRPDQFLRVTSVRPSLSFFLSFFIDVSFFFSSNGHHHHLLPPPLSSSRTATPTTSIFPRSGLPVHSFPPQNVLLEDCAARAGKFVFNSLSCLVSRTNHTPLSPSSVMPQRSPLPFPAPQLRLDVCIQNISLPSGIDLGMMLTSILSNGHDPVRHFQTNQIRRQIHCDVNSRFALLPPPPCLAAQFAHAHSLDVGTHCFPLFVNSSRLWVLCRD